MSCDVFGDPYESLISGQYMVVTSEVTTELLLLILIKVMLGHLCGDPLIDIGVSEVKFLTSIVIVERYGSAIFDRPLKVVLRNILSKDLACKQIKHREMFFG